MSLSYRLKHCRLIRASGELYLETRLIMQMLWLVVLLIVVSCSQVLMRPGYDEANTKQVSEKQGNGASEKLYPGDSTGIFQRGFSENKDNNNPVRKKRWVSKIRMVGRGVKFVYTVSKKGVKWLWVKTKNGFRRLGKVLDFLDRPYILGPMLVMEPSEMDPDYGHYDEYGFHDYEYEDEEK